MTKSGGSRQQGINILCDGVELMVINAKSRGIVLFSHQDNRCGPRAGGHLI